MTAHHRSRYSRYAGGPDPLAPPVDLAEALDAVAEDVMAGYSPRHALQEYLRRGGRNREGLDDLAGRVQQRRKDLLGKHKLDGTDRAFREMQLQNLPKSTAAAVNELASYDWQSSTAREAYERIKDLLGREILDQRFAGMKEALEGATEEDRAAVAEMLADLNELLDKHRRGEDTDADFQEFMASTASTS